jgi:hypothetical protein
LLTQQIQIPPQVHKIVSMPPFINTPVSPFINNHIPHQQVHSYQSNFPINAFNNYYSLIKSNNQTKVNEPNCSSIDSSDILAPSAAVQFCPINPKTINIK